MDSPAQWVPRVLEGAEITKLPIGPMEGFVLSRIDGRVTVADIADLTGFESVQVVATIEKLVGLGAATWAVGGPKPPTPRRAASIRPGRVDVEPEVDRASRHRSAAPPPVGPRGGLYDPKELEEEVDLDPDRRRQVLDTFYRLDDLSHYELLGIQEDAEKKEIRNAYFVLSKVFHPDTLFGKRLGSYKPKMEKVFHHLTEAYEVLGKKKKRAEYDEYLSVRKVTRAAQRTLEEGQQVAREVERERESMRPPAVAAASSPTPPPPPPTPEPVAAQAARANAPARPAVRPPNPEEAAERRRRTQEFTARRLANSLRPGSQPSGHPVADRASGGSPGSRDGGGGATSREHLLRGLTHSLRGAAAHTGGVDPVTRQLRMAKDLERSGNLAEAANALRLAVALDPERADVEEEYRRVDRALAASMADTYRKQAFYEERNEKWAEAALSWSRVADGAPDDPEPRYHAARCLLEGDGDLRRAKVLAESVVEVEPKHLEARILLARIFHRAGMTANAKREAEAAAKLDPGNDFVKNLLRELR